MIWDEREVILCREYIVSQDKILHTKLSLNEINKAKSKILRFLQLYRPFFTRHLDDIGIVIIAVDRPIDHIPSLRSLAVGDHHLRRPYCLSGLSSLVAERIEGGITENHRIISFRLCDCHIRIRAVILQESHECKILNHIISLIRCNRLPCFFRRLHSYLIVHSACLGNITQFGSIYENVGIDLLLAAP